MKPKQTDPMNDAYKMLMLGAPSSTGVSDAAKGNVPQNDMQEEAAENDQKQVRLGIQSPQDPKCTDIQNAYAMLFESLAVIMKSN